MRIFSPAAAGGDKRAVQYAQTGLTVIPRHAACPEWDSNPHCRRSERRASYQLGYRDKATVPGATQVCAEPSSPVTTAKVHERLAEIESATSSLGS